MDPPVYLYNQALAGHIQAQVLDQAGTDGTVRLVDVSSWSSAQRRRVYFDELLPRSLMGEKLLTGLQARDGELTFEAGVLVAGADLWVGEEALAAIDRLG